MAFDAKVLTFTANTSTGDQVLTGTTFTPKIAIVWYSRSAITLNTFAETVSFGFGATDGTNSRVFLGNSEDNQPSSDSLKHVREDSLIYTMVLTGTGGGQDSMATFVSFNSNGMTINWSDAPAAAFKFHVLFLGGSDITNAKVGTYTIVASAGGNENITGIGFQPDFLLNFGAVGTLNTDLTACAVQLGAVDTAGNQWAQNIHPENGRTTTDTWQYYSNAKMVTQLATTTGAIFNTHSFVSWLSDGFTVNNANAGGASIFYIALKGGVYAVGTGTEPAGTGNQTITTDKDTKAVMIFGVDTGTADTSVVDCMLTVGAGTSSSEMATVVNHDTDNVPDTICVSRYETDSIYLNITANATAGSSTVDDEASLNAVSSTGFTLNWSNIGQARPFRYITFGAAAEAAAAVEEFRAISFGTIGYNTNDIAAGSQTIFGGG